MPSAHQEHPGPLTEPTPLEVQGMRDCGQGRMNPGHGHAPEATSASPAPSPADHAAEPLVIDTKSQLGRGPMIAVAVVVVLLLVAVAFGIVSRRSHEKNLNAVTQQEAIPSVQTTHPSQGAQAQELRLPANTQAFVDTPIYSRTNGYLQKWFADIGTTVTRGQLLAIVQTPEVDQQVQQAEAQVNTARANEQLAETTANRWKNLLAKNAVSRQEADQASSDLTARQAALNAAQANLRRLQQMQGFERIYAPFSGIVTARNVDIGSLIQAGDSNAPHSELFHISSIDKLRLYVPVPEVYTGSVHRGEQVQVTSDAFPNETFTGTIARTSETIDPQTRTLNTEVDIDNPGHKMLPGQYAFVHLPLAAGTNSMTLPSNTILFRAEGVRVGLVVNGRVHLQPITIGHDYGAKVEVTSGLQPSDAVILNPSDSLAEGAEVRVAGANQ